MQILRHNFRNNSPRDSYSYQNHLPHYLRSKPPDNESLTHSVATHDTGGNLWWQNSSHFSRFNCLQNNLAKSEWAWAKNRTRDSIRSIVVQRVKPVT